MTDATVEEHEQFWSQAHTHTHTQTHTHTNTPVRGRMSYAIVEEREQIR